MPFISVSSGCFAQTPPEVRKMEAAIFKTLSSGTGSFAGFNFFFYYYLVNGYEL